MRYVRTAVAAVLIVAACGGADDVTTTTGGSSSTGTPTTAIEDLVGLVRSNAPPGMEIVPGREGPMGVDLVAEDSELATIALDAGLVDAYGALYKDPNDRRGYTVAGVARFESSTGAQQFLDMVEGQVADLLALGVGPMIEQQTGAELLPLAQPVAGASVVFAEEQGGGLISGCVRIDQLESDADLVKFWVNISDCFPGQDTTDVPLTCPTAMQPGDTGIAVLTTPVYAAPLDWVADPATVNWETDGPVEAEAVASGKVVSASVRAGASESSPVTASVSVSYRSASNLDSDGKVYTVNGAAVTGTCDIEIVDNNAPSDIAGAWTFVITVAPVNDYCTSSYEYTETFVFDQSGTEIKVTGIGGQEEAWTGTVAGDQVTFGGDKEDGEGMTSATFVMTVAGDAMTGDEFWSYEDDGGKCPDGTSTVTAVRAG